jgi:integrase
MRVAIPLTQREEDLTFAYLLNTKHKERDACIFAFQLKAGMRVGSLSKLTWDMLLNNKLAIREEFFIPKKILKWKKKDLLIFKNNMLWHYIHEHFKKNFTNRKDAVFIADNGLPFSVTNLTTKIFRMLRRVGFERSAHSLRKKAATDYDKEASKMGGGIIDTRDFLGQKDIKDTQRYIANDYQLRKIAAMAI